MSDLLRAIQDTLVKEFYDPDPADPTPEVDYAKVDWVAVIQQVRKQFDELKAMGPPCPMCGEGAICCATLGAQRWLECFKCKQRYQPVPQEPPDGQNMTYAGDTEPLKHELSCCEYHHHAPSKGCCALDCIACQADKAKQ